MKIFRHCLCLFFCASALFAQIQRSAVLESSDGYREVIATAQIDGSSTVADEQSAATALNKIAGGTNFISADDLKQSTTLEEALKAQPGISVRHFVGGHETINIRGSGVQSIPLIRGIYLLQDGLPMQRSDGSFLIGTMEPRSAQYMEILRGSNGFSRGSTTLGGSMDFISHTGYDAPLAQAAVEVGSFDYTGSQVSSGYQIDDIDYYISFTQSDQTGYRIQNNRSKKTVNFNVGYKLFEDVETRFFGTFVDQKFQVSGPTTKLNAENHPTLVAAGPPSVAGPNILRDDPKRQTELYRLANKTVWKDDFNQVELGFYWLNIDDRIQRTRPRGIAHYNSNDWGGEIRYKYEDEIGGHWNKFTTALIPSSGAMQMTSFQNLNGTAGALLGNHDLYSTTITFLTEDEFFILPDLAWIIGVQTSYTYREINERFTSLTSPGSQTYDYIGVNPRMGFRYEFEPRKFLFANVSRSFEPPVFDDIIATAGAANPNADPTRFDIKPLAPQTATTIEFGTRGSEGIFAWDVTFYNSWVENEIISFQNAAGTVVTENVDSQTIHQGIETGLTIDLWKNLADTGDKIQLRTVYNWSNFYFDHHFRYGTNNLAAIPEHMIFMDLQYIHPCGFYVGPNIEWMVTKTSVDHSHSQFQDPYAIMGFHVGYKTKKGFSVFVEACNILDDNYIGSVMARDRVANARQTSFMPGDAFSIKSGIEYKY